MICKECGKNNAEIYYKQTVNGQTVEYALCQECAGKLQKEGKISLNMHSLFDGFDFGFGTFNNLFGINYDKKKPMITEKKRCTLCSSTFDDLVKSGKVGCAECYKVFAEELKNSVESIHGKAKYIGKRPKKYKEKQTKEDRLNDLKEELKAAVSEQEFEKAAKLRDEIRALENEMGR